MKQATISFRPDRREREAFIRLCAANGVTPSSALRSLVRSALSKKALPVGRIPWYEVPETKAAIEEIETGGGKTFESIEDLMRGLQEGDSASDIN